MLSLDLFKSKFETQLHEGAVDSVAEQDQPSSDEKIPTNINQFTTEDNRALVKRIWAQISQHAVNDTAGWLTLEWPNQPAATLSRNQVWTVINKIAKMPATQRNAFALSTLGDRNAFLTWMNGLKIIPRPAPKKDTPRGQQSLDLKERDQKKSSEDPKFKSTRLDRLKTQARARQPAAASDTEAMIADFVDQQDQDQAEFNRVKNVNRRQDELLKQITDLNQAQDQEIDNLENEEARLQQNVKQIQAANAALAQKLVAMSQRRVQAQSEPAPAPTPTVGVSVATDKVAAAPATTAPAIDPRARRYAQQLRKQLNQLQTMVALKAPEDQNQLKQDIDALKAQLAKLQQKEPVATATPATIGGQAADIMPARDSRDTDDGVIDLTGVDDVLAQFRQSGKKSAKKKAKAKEPEFELAEADSIPLKSVVQGYNIEYNPRTRQVTVSRRGQVVGTAINKSNNASHHLTLINRIIDRAEEDKYPTDIDDRDVALPMRKNVHENKSSEAYEQGGRAGYYGRPYNNPYESGTDGHADYKRGYRDFRDEGKDYGVEKKKQSPSIDRDRDFLEAQDQDQPTDEVMKRLFKDFGDIFGKQPPHPKPQETEKKEVKEMGRAGFNPLRSREDWLDVQEHLARLMNTPGMSYEDKQVIRQRYLEKQKEAQEKGFTK